MIPKDRYRRMCDVGYITLNQVWFYHGQHAQDDFVGWLTAHKRVRPTPPGERADCATTADYEAWLAGYKPDERESNP